MDSHLTSSDNLLVYLFIYFFEVSTAFKLCQHFIELCAAVLQWVLLVAFLHATVWVTNVMALQQNECVLISTKAHSHQWSCSLDVANLERGAITNQITMGLAGNRDIAGSSHSTSQMRHMGWLYSRVMWCKACKKIKIKRKISCNLLYFWYETVTAVC